LDAVDSHTDTLRKQTSEDHAIFCDYFRYRSHWSYSTFPVFPNRAGESSCQGQHTKWTLWSHVPAGKCPACKIYHMKISCLPFIPQMSGMMGVNANQEDMFSKLEEMRSVITEVNNQFKDPVSYDLCCWMPSVLIGIITRSTLRTQQPLSAFAFQNSCLCMKLRE
jgi:hypothetical protein